MTTLSITAQPALNTAALEDLFPTALVIEPEFDGDCASFRLMYCVEEDVPSFECRLGADTYMTVLVEFESRTFIFMVLPTDVETRWPEIYIKVSELKSECDEGAVVYSNL